MAASVVRSSKSVAVGEATHGGGGRALQGGGSYEKN